MKIKLFTLEECIPKGKSLLEEVGLPSNYSPLFHLPSCCFDKEFEVVRVEVGPTDQDKVYIVKFTCYGYLAVPCQFVKEVVYERV